MHIPPDVRRYLRFHLERMKETDRAALQAAGKYQSRKAEIMHKVQRDGISDYNARKMMEDDWELRDAGNAYNWNAGESQRCATMMVATMMYHLYISNKLDQFTQLIGAIPWQTSTLPPPRKSPE